MQTYLKKYKFQNLLIILELICTNLLLLASTLITMRMARLVMDGDFKGIVICSLLIIVIYLILHFLFLRMVWIQMSEKTEENFQVDNGSGSP